MRFATLLLVFVLFTTLSGCGGKSGPVTPAQVTPEQERQMKEEQQKVDAAERQQAAKQGAGGRELSPQEQVDAQERARQGR